MYADANTILRDIDILPERFLQAVEELMGKRQRQQRVLPRDYAIILHNLEILANVITKIVEIPLLSRLGIDADWLEGQDIPSDEVEPGPDDSAADAAAKDVMACVKALRYINKLIATNQNFTPGNIRALYHEISRLLEHMRSHIEYDLDDEAEAREAADGAPDGDEAPGGR